MGNKNRRLLRSYPGILSIKPRDLVSNKSKAKPTRLPPGVCMPAVRLILEENWNKVDDREEKRTILSSLILPVYRFFCPRQPCFKSYTYIQVSIE